MIIFFWILFANLIIDCFKKMYYIGNDTTLPKFLFSFQKEIHYAFNFGWHFIHFFIEILFDLFVLTIKVFGHILLIFFPIVNINILQKIFQNLPHNIPQFLPPDLPCPLAPPPHLPLCGLCQQFVADFDPLAHSSGQWLREEWHMLLLVVILVCLGFWHKLLRFLLLDSFMCLLCLVQCQDVLIRANWCILT